MSMLVSKLMHVSEMGPGCVHWLGVYLRRLVDTVRVMDWYPQVTTGTNTNQDPRCHMPLVLNTLRSRQNGHQFPDDTFKYIFLN